MNLSRCSQGHFYDKEKFASCPHCGTGAGGEDGITMAFTEDLGNDYIEPTQPLSEVTQPLDASDMYMQQPVMAQPIPEPQPFGQPSDPYASAQQMAAESIPAPPPIMPAPVVPPAPAAVAAAKEEEEDEDSDVTVGFFSSVFDIPAKEESKTPESKAPQTGSKKPARRASASPCVGWLVAIGGNHVGEDFRLKAGKNFIGRDAAMDVALTNDKSVSRNKHAIVTYEPKQHLYLVQPGESSELAYLNNEVILTPVRIKAYDMITVGDVNLLFMPLCGDRFDWTELPDEVE